MTRRATAERMPTRQATAERDRSSLQSAATSTFLLPLGRTATSTEALIPSAFHPLADSVPPSFRMLPHAQHRRSDDASPRMPVNYEFESVKAAGYTVGLRSHTPFAPGWVPHRNVATVPQHQTLSSPRNMSPRPLVPLSPNTASFRHEMRQLPLQPPLTAASHAVHAAHAGAHADVRRAHAIHVARVMQWDRSMRGLSRSATSLGPPSTAYGDPRPLAGAIAAMDPAIGAIHAMHAAARTAHVKVRIVVDVSGLRPSASLPALAHAPSLAYSHFAKAPIIDGRAMTPLTEQTTQLVARYQPAGYAPPAPKLSEHHAMQVAKSALSRTPDESPSDLALEGACRPWTGTEGGGGSSGGSGARAAAKASGALPPPLADYDAAPAAAYPPTTFSSLDRPRATGPSGRRAPATDLPGPAAPETARAEGSSFPTGFPSEPPSASQHSHSQSPAALTGFRALRSLDSPSPAEPCECECEQPAAYGGVNVNAAAYGGVNVNAAAYDGGRLGGLESMAGPVADDGSWPGADVHILDANAHLNSYTWPAEPCAQDDASLSDELGAELGMPVGPGEDQPGRRGKFRIIGPAKDAQYDASLWAMKFGARGKSMQERILEEAQRRRGKKVNLSDVTKGLLLNRRIVAALRACTVFHGLDSLHLSMMAYGGHNMRMKRYGVVYRAGAVASSFFVLTHGSVQIISDDGPPQTITVERGARQGIAFGFESLGSGSAVSGGSGLCRQATVCALEASSLVVFSTKDMRLDQGRLEKLAERIFAETAAAALRITPVFADLTPVQLVSLAPLFEFAAFNPNTPFFSAGGACDKLFVLLNGSMVVRQRTTTIATLHSTVGDGSAVWHPFVGAEGLLDAETRRPYDVVTCTPANALVLPTHALKRFLKSVPNLYDRLQEFSEMRRKAWELECGLSLSLEYDSVPEAAQDENPAQAAQAD